MLIKQYKQPRIKQHMLHTIVPASTYSIYLISYPTLALVQRLDYCQTTDISRTKSQNLNVSRLVLWFLFAQSGIDARCSVWNEDVGAAPTPSEWSTIILPTKERLILGSI